MKKTILSILTVTLLSCGQQTDKSAETNNVPQADTVVKDNKAFTVEKYEVNEDEISDSIFTVDKVKYKVTVKNYVKGDYTIADTMENRITLYKEEFIDITIDDKTVTISKSMFSDIYQDKNQLYHSGFGTAHIDKIDKKNKKIIFSTFCGFHQSDFGEVLYYSITLDGKYEFEKVEVPKEH